MSISSNFCKQMNKMWLKIFVFLFFNNITNTKSNIEKNIIKSNVLIIFIDDLRQLSEDEFYLSNIQKLAAKGISFRNSFAQQALCAPSRNSILTGRRPDTLRLYDFYSYWRDDISNYSTFPQIFKENGYETYSIGKIFHPGKSSNYTDDWPYSWSKMPYHPPTERYKNAAVCKDHRTKKLENNLLCAVTLASQPDKILPDLESVDFAIDLLRNRNKSKPFLMAIGFHKPHIPLKYPHKYLRKVPISEVKPPSMPYMPKNIPLVAWHPWTDVRERNDIRNLNISYPLGTMPSKWTLKIRQNYYAASLYIDNLVGKLLKQIDHTNTIVILTSDHGWSLGENGLWAKYSNFDVALKVPLIFKVPGMLPKSISTPVELLDIFPTILELANLNTVPKCKDVNEKSKQCYEGNSLVPFMKTSKYNNLKPFAISQYPRPSVYPEKNSDKPHLKDIKIMGYSIRTKRYRYTEWISFNSTLFSRNWSTIYGVELYDHIINEDESYNFHLNPKYKHVEQKLSHILRSQIDPNEYTI